MIQMLVYRRRRNRARGTDIVIEMGKSPATYLTTKKSGSTRSTIFKKINKDIFLKSQSDYDLLFSWKIPEKLRDMIAP